MGGVMYTVFVSVNEQVKPVYNTKFLVDGSEMVSQSVFANMQLVSDCFDGYPRIARYLGNNLTLPCCKV